jgi:anti-sigma B factor antagonist
VELTCVREDRPDATVLTVTGEVDVHSAPALREALVEAEARGLTIVVDLSGVPFMDSTGLGVLIGALGRAIDEDRRFVLCAIPERIDRLLSLTGLADRFEVAKDSAHALGLE